MLRDRGRGSTPGQPKQRSIPCDECTIQIGDGYQESIPFQFVDDGAAAKPQVLTVCWRCWESLNRRKNKRAAESPGEQGPPSLIR